MSEWWHYRPEDFLHFSPDVYWRLFELHNQAVWPLPIVAPFLGALTLVALLRHWRGANRLTAVVLAAAWGFVAWAYFWNRYATVNWAASYAALLIVLPVVLLTWQGVVRDRLRFEMRWDLPGSIGLLLFTYALLLHPFVAILSGRTLLAGEVFAVAPDPTAIATLGLLTTAVPAGVTWLVLIVPIILCLASWATLYTMGVWEAWIPFSAAVAALAARLWARGKPRLQATS